MKHIYIIGVLASAACLTACSDEAILTPEIPQLPFEKAEGTYVRLGATTGDDQTRVGITDNNTHFSYTWEAGDALNVFNATTSGYSTTKYILDEGFEGTNAATFTSATPVNYKDGESLYAFYNGNQEVEWDENGNIILDISDQDGTLSDKYQYMLGTTTYDADGTTRFSMKHLVSTIKVKLKAPNDLNNIKSISLIPYHNSGYLATTASLVMTGVPNDPEGNISIGDIYRSFSEDLYDSRLTIERDFEVDSNNEITVYFYVLPAKIQSYEGASYTRSTNVSSGIIVETTDGETYITTCNYSSRTLYQGDIYELNSELFKLVDFENESEAYGNEWDPYEIANADQFYSFMFRTSRRMRNKIGNGYYYCSYFLSNDIVLNNECNWSGAYLDYYSGFDGMNHSIKGKITMANSLFDEVRDATIKNIILDAEVTCDYLASVFVRELRNNSTIENCHNLSDIKTSNWQFGTIAQYAYNSKIIACGNQGSIIGNWCDMAGIAAQMSGETAVNGCYDVGVHRVSSNYSPLSGLVSSCDGNPIIKNSWSACDFGYDPVETTEEDFCYYSGITMYMNSSQLDVSNCYWNNSIATQMCINNYGTINAINCGTFSDSFVPTPEQIEAMNKGLEKDTKYQFNAQGIIELTKKTIINPSEIEEW